MLLFISFNSYKLSVLQLIAGIIILKITITNCVETTENKNAIKTNSRSCCSFRSFQCDNVTGPATIQCDKPHSIVLLQPNRSESDQFTLREGPENNGLGVMLLENHKIANFCIGWFPESDGNITDKGALACMNGASQIALSDSDPFDFVMYASGLLLSVACGLLTLAVYILLPWLRDLQGKIIMSLLVCVCIGYSSLATIQLHTHHLTQRTCVFMGFMVYFWIFASFNWLHISSFNIWRTIALRSNHALFKDKTTLFYIYSAVGWGVPILHLIISLILEYGIEGSSIRPGIGEYMCFIYENKSKWILFYGPILVLILGNIYYFVSVIHHLGKMHKIQSQLDAQRAAAADYKQPPSGGKPVYVRSNTLIQRTDKHKRKVTASVTKFNTYSKLFFAMGLTFIFEIISAIYHSGSSDESKSSIIVFVLIVMDIVNALQGVILFIILVLLRKKVLLKLGERLNINLGKLCPCLMASQSENDDCDEDYETSECEDDNDQRRITNNGNINEQRIIEEIQMI